MAKTREQAESSRERRGTPGPFPEAFLALLPVFACFLGGGTEKWGEGIIYGLLGIYLLVRPPRRSLGIALNLTLLALLLCAASAFLPSNWFFQPSWRAVDANDFGIVLPGTASPQPWITFTCMFSLLAGLSWFYIVASEQLGLHEARTTLRWFSAGVVLLAGICILFWLAKNAPPFWHNERNFGPFPNRNQTANLFSLTAIIILACGQDDIRKGRKRWIFWVLGLAIIVAAIIINYSRAGIGILIAGCALWLGLFSLCQRSHSASRIALVFSFLLLLATALLLFGGQTLERFHLHNLGNVGISSDFRWRIFSDAFRLIADSPWAGIGLGNFENVFAIFRAASYSDRRAIHPESDWLWLTSEAGWLAVALVLIVLALIVPKVFPMREGTNQRYRLATLIACGLFILHGLIDVSGHRVGTAFAGILLLGVSLHRPHSFRISRILPFLFRGVGLVLIVIGMGWIVQTRTKNLWSGSLGVTNAKYLAGVSNRERNFPETVEITNKALQWAPLDWELYFSRAIAEVELKEKDNAVADFRRARFLEPISFELPLVEGNTWLRSEPVLAATAWREALRRAGSDRPGVYSQMLTKASLRNPQVSQILSEMGVSHHDLALPYLARISGAEFNRALAKVLENDPELKSFTEPEKFILFSYWSDRGEAAELSRAIEQHRDWLPYAWFGLAKARANTRDFRGAYELTRHYGDSPALPRVSLNTTDRLQLESRFRASPDTYAIGYELYRAQEKEGRIDDALQTVRHFSDRHNTPAYWKYLEAQLWAEKGNFERAWNAWLKFHDAQSSK
ncbi:MAG TPA: O-antigen ligase family protein [Chthoniobacterales bacterium]|nr:O-antigen ligase family protein [Chthoniobacterales bacterium]